MVLLFEAFALVRIRVHRREQFESGVPRECPRVGQDTVWIVVVVTLSDIAQADNRGGIARHLSPFSTTWAFIASHSGFALSTSMISRQLKQGLASPKCSISVFRNW